MVDKIVGRRGKRGRGILTADDADFRGWGKRAGPEHPTSNVQRRTLHVATLHGYIGTSREENTGQRTSFPIPFPRGRPGERTRMLKEPERG
jgi:hypothetical protein